MLTSFYIAVFNASESTHESRCNIYIIMYKTKPNICLNCKTVNNKFILMLLYGEVKVTED